MNKDTKKAPSLDKEYGALKNNLPVNNTIVCQGTIVDADYLMQQASMLTDTNNQLEIILELLSLQACSKDNAMAIYFTKSTIPKLTEALQGLVERFQEVADDICPD
ncbi:hypothetical protein ACI3EJ_01885 [Ligilactobacillus acidipiscis]|uniref:hypothetical protein n=1 Tax=Ligilactobacillus acidipiscis TaxID=89059 RepID=UPI00386E4A40